MQSTQSLETLIGLPDIVGYIFVFILGRVLAVF